MNINYKLNGQMKQIFIFTMHHFSFISDEDRLLDIHACDFLKKKNFCRRKNI